MAEYNNGHTAIVAHDAGAAEQIFAWLESGMLRIEKCKFCLKGPAKKSFKALNKNLISLPLEDVLTGAELLLSGTGWSSSLEHDARALAKKKELNQ